MMEVRPMGPTVWCRAGTWGLDCSLPILLRYIAIRGVDYALQACPNHFFYILSALSGDKGKFTADES